jgi:hypothetical protein
VYAVHLSAVGSTVIEAVATASNIMGSEALFRLGLASFQVVFVLDLVIAWALYVLFRHLNRDVSSWCCSSSAVLST